MKQQSNLEVIIGFKNIIQTTKDFITKQRETTGAKLEGFKTLSLEESNTEGRLFQAVLNMNQQEMKWVNLDETKKLKIYCYAFAFCSMSQDKPLALFLLNHSGLGSNKELLSFLINELYPAIVTNTDYLKSLLSFDIDLTYLGGSISCLFSKLLENSDLTEDYLISLLPKVSEANVNNQRLLGSGADPQKNPDGSYNYDNVADQPEPYPLLMAAIDAGRFKLAENLVEPKGADANFSYTDSTGFVYSVATTAYNSGNAGMVEFLVNHGCTSELPSYSFHPQALHSFRRLSPDANTKACAKKADAYAEWLHNKQIHSWQSLGNIIKFIPNFTSTSPGNLELNEIRDKVMSQIKSYFSSNWNKCMLICKEFPHASNDIVKLIGSFVFVNKLAELGPSPEVVKVTGEADQDN